jgi:endonuclease/exonuclease/phosphatase family metal-dependent hydrolase
MLSGPFEMKKLIVVLAVFLGLPFLVAANLFFYMRSPNWAKADYNNLVTYNTYPTGPEEPDDFTVVSYNIGYLSGLTNQAAVERDRALLTQNQATAIAALRQADADIIGFQEIDFDAYRSFNSNQQYAISSALSMPFAAIAINWDKRYVPFPYWPPAVHYQKVVSGQAILSRYPILDNQRVVLERVPSNPFYYNALYLDRVAQVAEIDLAGQPLIVINVHLEAFDSPTRTRQSEFVRTLAEDYAEDYPVLLIGDFNSSLNRDAEGESRSIQVFLDSPVFESAVPQDSLTAAATFPSDQPTYTLDYIFYTPKTLELLNWQVIEAAAQASDHLPIQATLKQR